jgi:hypothetical protein
LFVNPATVASTYAAFQARHEDAILGAAVSPPGRAFNLAESDKNLYRLQKM